MQKRHTSVCPSPFFKSVWCLKPRAEDITCAERDFGTCGKLNHFVNKPAKEISTWFYQNQHVRLTSYATEAFTASSTGLGEF